MDKELHVVNAVTEAEGRPKTGSIRKRAASSNVSSPDDKEVSTLLSEFIEGGSKRMTSEVSKLVSESGKILGRIQDLENDGGDEGGEDGAGGGNGGGGDGEATVFMSPYLYDDIRNDLDVDNENI